jgi:hypothetical protein
MYRSELRYVSRVKLPALKGSCQVEQTAQLGADPLPAEDYPY